MKRVVAAWCIFVLHCTPPEPPPTADSTQVFAVDRTRTAGVRTGAAAVPERTRGGPAAPDCARSGKRLFGKVQVVSAFADLKVQKVDAFADLKVQLVDAFADSCGEWQLVDAFPDFTIQWVDSFPDLKVQLVTSFPGR